jgi:hypothetical protein
MGIGLSVEGQSRGVPRKTFPVREPGVLLLNPSTVGQKDRAEIARTGGCEDVSPETVSDEKWKPAAVIEMGVGEDHCIDRCRIDRKWFTILLPKMLESLEESTVDEDPFTARFEQEFRSGDRRGRSEEGELHRELS